MSQFAEPEFPCREDKPEEAIGATEQTLQAHGIVPQT